MLIVSGTLVNRLSVLMVEYSENPSIPSREETLQRLRDARVPKPKKEKQPIAKRSDKLQDEMKLYKPQVKAYLAKPENQDCKIKADGVCQGKATCVNHKKRRGKNLREEKYWEPACEPCNNFCESNPKWAYDNGHLISVHKIEEK
jgi:hypothetical protein